MNLIQQANIVVFSSLSSVELKVGEALYEIHEIEIHEFLNMPGVTSDGAVALTRLAKSDEYEVKHQQIEEHKRYVASLVSGPRGLMYSMYDESTPIAEATYENIEKYKRFVELYDNLCLGI